jgi:hypothetical protein
LLNEVGWSPHFRPMRDFKYQWSRALKLWCEVPLIVVKQEFTFEDISSSSLSNCASDDNLDPFLDTSDCASPSAAAAAAPSVTLSVPKTPSEGRFYRTKDGQFSARPRFDVLLNFVLYNQACMFKIVKTLGRQYSSCSCG